MSVLCNARSRKVCKRCSYSDGAPASVTENVETVIRIENEALRPCSRSEAITDAIGGFVGAFSFVELLGLNDREHWDNFTDPSFDPFPTHCCLRSPRSRPFRSAFVLMKQTGWVSSPIAVIISTCKSIC
jgi:hypothetical protein